MQTRLLVALALALTAPACMVGSGDPLEADDPTEDDLPPLTSEASLGNNARTAFNFFVAKGLTQTQAAGVVGNLMQESSVRPTAVQYGGGPGRGIAQWSIGGRWNRGSTNMVSFAAARGLDRWSLNAQLDFIWHELSTNAAYGLAGLRAATTLSAAVTVFQNKYEICGACEQGKRLQYAQQALTDFGGASAGAGSGTGSGSGSGSGSGGGGNVPSATCYSGTLGRDVPTNTCVESMYDGLWYQCAYGSWVDRWSDPEPCIAEYPL